MVYIVFQPVIAITGTTSVDLPPDAPDIAKLETTTSPKNIFLWGSTSGIEAQVKLVQNEVATAWSARRFTIAFQANRLNTVHTVGIRYRAVGEVVRT